MSIDREIKKTVDDVGDALHEGLNRTAAEGERTKRDLAGDQMTAGEKVKSMINEGKHEISAGVDRAKRDIRDTT